MMTDLIDCLQAYYSENPPAPAWAIGDTARQPYTAAFVVAAVAVAGGFPRHLVVSDAMGRA